MIYGENAQRHGSDARCQLQMSVIAVENFKRMLWLIQIIFDLFVISSLDHVFDIDKDKRVTCL